MSAKGKMYASAKMWCMRIQPLLTVATHRNSRLSEGSLGDILDLV